ncbi:MAG: cupin domain-containing protein [Flavobacteriales bacterium]
MKRTFQPNFPFTIENKHGEKLTFLRLAKDERGERIEVENWVQPGCGPVMHVHYHQDEELHVQSGKMGYQVAGGLQQFAEAGESIRFQRGVMHRFWNAGDVVLNCTGSINPPNNIVYYLWHIYRLMDEGGGQPKGFDAAYLVRKYRTEFDVEAIPAFVKSVIFPVIVFFGMLGGKHKKFADAPEAVS